MATAVGQIQVRLSVKIIKNADGTRPGGSITTAAGFHAEVIRGNQILAETWRGYQLIVVEYLDIQPSAPPGQASDYWFNINARENRATIEFAATIRSDFTFAKQLTVLANNGPVTIGQ